ncbi:TetR/AcrR family transcriptional regulator [Streptococcus iniae]|nr:TetR/AcrR family transcriptional regulator [Streptococcus iniae]AGM98736.1 TetR family transcriptional regulator [Streptococcus iniae SF1]AJG25870.1 TetR family transcriptional regulator [Streptococcus iniae]APD31741.1 TetR family transcriptional regulator [Streptococcus iniae]ASL34685.1 TetR family transcriptional regulator [Streptococcus iniae]ATX39651.1 putative HTH-type transcriptional regulator YvdT [Streptococcus iniae]
MKRQTQSKNCLKEALISLLLEKPFEAITVSDLCQKAGINRGTFYLHYQDKNDMMEQLKNNILDHLFLILDDASIYSEPKLVLEESLYFIKDNFSFVAALAQSSYVNFKQVLKDFIYQVLVTIDNYQTIITSHYNIPFPYALEVYLSSIECIISYWVSQGGKESPKELTQIILNTVSIDQKKN